MRNSPTFPFYRANAVAGGCLRDRSFQMRQIKVLERAERETEQVQSLNPTAG
jgi:hypothetical protein